MQKILEQRDFAVVTIEPLEQVDCERSTLLRVDTDEELLKLIQICRKNRQAITVELNFSERSDGEKKNA